MNQKTIQTLDTLAEEYGTIEATMKKVTPEYEEGDVLYAVASEVASELDRAQKDQDRLEDELDCSCVDLATASREFSNCWATQEEANAKLCIAFREICNRRAAHEVICVEARRARQKTIKASEAQETQFSHREGTRSISNEHARAEALVNDGLGTLGQAVRDAAQATHSDLRSTRQRK